MQQDQSPQPLERVARRRDETPEIDDRSVTFTSSRLSAEKLEALRAFLAGASAQEVEAVRLLYGETPEVLQWVSMEAQ